jgi:hypothetical protein
VSVHPHFSSITGRKAPASWESVLGRRNECA